MKWKSFHIENMDSVTFFGLNLALLFGHTPDGNPVLTFIVNIKKWSKALQLGG